MRFVPFFALLSGFVVVGCQPPYDVDLQGIRLASETIRDAQLNVRLRAAGQSTANDMTNPPLASAAPPAGYVEVGVQAASGPEFGDAVVLIDAKGRRVIPVYIGGTEALSIRLRLEERRFRRPLTHDLLDDMMRQLGGKVVRVQVDDIRGGVYYGSVVMERGGQLVSFDARPSDAVALAVGNHAPIFVSGALLDSVAVDVDEVHDGPPPRARGVDPVAL